MQSSAHPLRSDGRRRSCVISPRSRNRAERWRTRQNGDDAVAAAALSGERAAGDRLVLAALLALVLPVAPVDACAPGVRERLPTRGCTRHLEPPGHARCRGLRAAAHDEPRKPARHHALRRALRLQPLPRRHHRSGTLVRPPHPAPVARAWSRRQRNRDHALTRRAHRERGVRERPDGRADLGNRVNLAGRGGARAALASKTLVDGPAAAGDAKSAPAARQRAAHRTRAASRVLIGRPLCRARLALRSRTPHPLRRRFVPRHHLHGAESRGLRRGLDRDVAPVPGGRSCDDGRLARLRLHDRPIPSGDSVRRSPAGSERHDRPQARVHALGLRGVGRGGAPWAPLRRHRGMPLSLAAALVVAQLVWRRVVAPLLGGRVQPDALRAQPFDVAARLADPSLPFWSSFIAAPALLAAGRFDLLAIIFAWWIFVWATLGGGVTRRMALAIGRAESEPLMESIRFCSRPALAFPSALASACLLLILLAPRSPGLLVPVLPVWLYAGFVYGALVTQRLSLREGLLAAHSRIRNGTAVLGRQVRLLASFAASTGLVYLAAATCTAITWRFLTAVGLPAAGELAALAILAYALGYTMSNLKSLQIMLYLSLGP